MELPSPEIENYVNTILVLTTIGGGSVPVKNMAYHRLRINLSQVIHPFTTRDKETLSRQSPGSRNYIV
jgi:hypothetical protein